MATFNKISKGSDAYAKAVETFDALVDRFDYDGMAKAYNDLAIGEILTFDYKRGKASVVRQQMEKRGLTNGADFDVRSAAQEGNEDTATVLIQRNSDKPAGAVQHAARGRKPGSTTAPAAAATAATAGAPAADANGKPAADAKPKAK